MTDFSDYHLLELRQGRGVYELADGLIPEMAEVFEVDLGDTPTSEALGALVGKIGTSQLLRENIPQVQAALGTDQTGLEIAADWLERSGVQKPLDRSLWTPELMMPDDVDGIVITGAVANWQERTSKLLVGRAREGQKLPTVFCAVGNAVMDSGTELTNLSVQKYYETRGSYPTQAQFAGEVVRPRLVEAGYEVNILPFETKSGEVIAEGFVERYNDLLHGKLAFARVANAGIQLAVQFRNAARRVHPKFDTDPSNPQVFVLTDSFPVARTEEEGKNAAEYQNPLSGIRQIGITAKSLQESL